MYIYRAFLFVLQLFLNILPESGVLWLSSGGTPESEFEFLKSKLLKFAHRLLLFLRKPFPYIPALLWSRFIKTRFRLLTMPTRHVTKLHATKALH